MADVRDRSTTPGAAHLGIGLDEYRRQLGELLAPFTEIAAANPQRVVPGRRGRPTRSSRATPENRMVGYPYTKYMVSIMDVDMAAAVLVASHEAADALGVPPEQRVYLRGWCYATDPIYVAEHDEMWRSPAMAAAAREAFRVGGRRRRRRRPPRSVQLLRELGELRARRARDRATTIARSLTVTGGLPYHGGAGSDYMTHSIATMADVLRARPRLVRARERRRACT